ncbi:MAG TPA: 3-keto-5-aminohexanoate cleavage protein, partial [Acidimicrobiia bacterium]|nr:3-keto-5-aminohexanoate cleavage protein [Acidimicrobiia bacterium]
MTTPVIIEAALNGVTNPAQNPNVAATSEGLAKDALACVDAGATVIHTHAPNLALPPEDVTEEYATTYRPVVEQRPGVICYP